MPHPVLDLAGFLAGPWRIERRIVDLGSGTTGRLTGEALFAPAPGGLRYDERGTLAFGAHRFEAGRGYRFALDHSGHPGAAEVRFEDDRPFHRLDLSRGRADVVHDCAPDRYRGRYRVIGRDRWALAWLVHGPRKRLLIGTRYSRFVDPAGTESRAARTRSLDGVIPPGRW